GSIAISSTGRQALARLAEGLRKSPDNSRIRIVGHTDAWPVGETLRARFTDNWELSAARAAAVARVLVWGEDIPETRIQVEGRAHTKPVAKNDSAKGRAKNRRIEVFVETAN
ncbi:MAG: flagellar motor protein MotB, partial [Mariprofundaceae bacterium]